MASFGAQPCGLGPGGLLRLTTKTRLPSADVATALGYQPVGTSPVTVPPVALGATMATALIPPSVTSNRPSRSWARPLGLSPLPIAGAASASGKPVAIVLGGEQSVIAGIGQQGGGLADRRDPAGDPDSRPRRRQRDNLPIAGRRHPGMAGIGPCDRKGILAARNAALRRVDLSGTQVLLGDDRTAIQVEQAHRVIVIVGDESVMPIRADRDARRLRLDPGTEAGGVAEPDRRGFDIPPA
ncbi:hypothetical protein WR25_23841 [Diploscapter pachys]|uniref:Uncharacterized protein n=1 Tax=Diploscapter pachys TaxID=2018661 RepID=A0A2A2M256_9BILA|nr:hypothetical protein WR25_23841 [Diploscapter pachys]